MTRTPTVLVLALAALAYGCRSAVIPPPVPASPPTQPAAPTRPIIPAPTLADPDDAPESQSRDE